jgi:hypothetical protein
MTGVAKVFSEHAMANRCGQGAFKACRRVLGEVAAPHLVQTPRAHPPADQSKQDQAAGSARSNVVKQQFGKHVRNKVMQG